MSVACRLGYVGGSTCIPRRATARLATVRHSERSSTAGSGALMAASCVQRAAFHTLSFKAAIVFSLTSHAVVEGVVEAAALALAPAPAPAPPPAPAAALAPVVQLQQRGEMVVEVAPSTHMCSLDAPAETWRSTVLPAATCRPLVANLSAEAPGPSKLGM